MTGLREIYEAEFEDRVFALQPKSVLDVGCGEGQFLCRAAARGISATGIDSNPERVARTRENGLDTLHASAQSLPFADLSFDGAVCERSAHHFSDLAAGLAEAIRVARDLYVFDPWYDETIPSQKSAADLDRWMKRVDAARGHVNNGPFSAQDILDALPRHIVSPDVSIVYRLNLMPVAVADAAAEAERQLAGWDAATPYRHELETLLSGARRTGLTGTGALMVFIRRTQ
jgi:SAM-dependent methyltransferase